MTDHDFPWFPFYPADWMTSPTVQRLTAAQAGAYVYMLSFQWREGYVPDDVDMLARMSNSTPNDVRTVLERCFSAVEGAFQNERLEEIRSEQVAKRQQKVRAGKASAKARKRRRLQKATPFEQRSNGASTPFQQEEVEVEEEVEEETEDRAVSTTTSERSVSQPNEDEIEMNDAETLRLLPRPALAVLGDLKHLGGKKATARTLVACYLYEDEGDAMPDQWIKGVESLEERVDIVARALIEYGSQNDTFNAAHFRGFVKRVRNAPKPETEAARVAKQREPVRFTPYQGETRKPSELARISAEEFAKLAGVEIPASKRKPEEKPAA